MEHIPISFEHKGKKYAGRFEAVHGAGQNIFHLMDDQNFYLGRLRKANDKWEFDGTPKSQDLTELADYFGNHVVAWHE